VLLSKTVPFFAIFGEGKGGTCLLKVEKVHEQREITKTYRLLGFFARKRLCRLRDQGLSRAKRNSQVYKKVKITAGSIGGVSPRGTEGAAVESDSLAGRGKRPL